MALDICYAMNYLHLCNPPILHRDLKSLNVVLDENKKCKLVDFGWARVMNEEANYMTVKSGLFSKLI